VRENKVDKKELLNHLWTARWYLNRNDAKNALPEVSKVIDLLEGKTVEEEKDRPSNPMPSDFGSGFTEPEFVTVKGVKFQARGNYQTASGTFEGLVVHYTVSNRTQASARAVVSWLASQNLGCMVMDEDGKIYIPEGFDVLKHWGHHAGTSKWGNRTSVSKYFAGMEICGWGLNSKVGPYREAKKGDGYIVAGKYQAFTEAQEKSLVNFILWAKHHNKAFNLDNVVGHDELRKEAGKLGDKQDPGASLSMTMPKFREHLKSLAKK
jgi:N-acetyl-anhydromuramyl-L-alanine amidase AmpD